MLMYVADYITKSPLKLYDLFQILAEVNKNSSVIIGGEYESHVQAHKLITKIVNIMSAQMQIGEPMAAAYLLNLLLAVLQSLCIASVLCIEWRLYTQP